MGHVKQIVTKKYERHGDTQENTHLHEDPVTIEMITNRVTKGCMHAMGELTSWPAEFESAAGEAWFCDQEQE